MTELKTERKLRIVNQIFFLIYFLVLLKMTLFADVTLTSLGSAFFRADRTVNYIPLIRTIDMGRTLPASEVLGYILKNVILFLPFGWLLPSVSPFEGETCIYGMLMSLLIEVCKLLFAIEEADIDHLFFGLVGAFIGYWIYVLVRTIIKKQNNVLIFFIAFSAIVLIAAVCVSYFQGTLL